MRRAGDPDNLIQFGLAEGWRETSFPLRLVAPSIRLC